MKNFKFFSVFTLVVLFANVTFAQPWILQRATGLPNWLNPAARYTALDNSVCWGISSISPLYIRTTNGGQNWTVSTITGATGGSTSIAALDANTAWVCNSEAVYKTSDGGLTWDKQETAFQGFNGNPILIHFFDSNNGVCVGNPNNGYWAIYTTTDGGTNWVRVPSGDIPPPLNTSELGISSVAITSGNSFWFHTFWGSLYRTTNRGITWTVARNILGNSEPFSFAFKDNLNGLACTFVGDKKIAKTSNGGITWTPILPLPSGLSGLSPFFLAYVKGTDSSYVITANSNIGGINPAISGSAYSNNNGTTWNYINNLAYGSASFSSPNNGWCAGMNDSVYKWVGFSPTVVDEAELSIVEYKLSQNYPNPFNPATTIKFSIPSSGFITLKVFDVVGREVATLVNEEKSAGSYEVNFNASQLSSGIYFYKIRSGNFVVTKKMVLIK